MEAVNLGAYLADQPDSAEPEAIDLLGPHPDFRRHEEYTAAAVAVREHVPAPATSGRTAGGLAISTWQNEDIPQPANLFAARTAKFLADPVPEEKTLAICRGRTVFAPRAGRAPCRRSSRR
jgi:hypothetical protein